MKPLLRSLTLLVALVLLTFTLQTWLKEVTVAVEQGTTHRDSLQFYTGATLVRNGEANDLYNLDTQRSLQRQLLPERYRLPLGFDFIPFVSPPFVGLALAPLSALSLPFFYILAGIANLVLLVVLLVALQKVAVGWPESWRLALVVLSFMWLPVTWSLREGQVSIFLAVSLIAGYLALRSQRDIVAGIVLGLLWVKPQYGVLILPVLLLWGRWRAASAFVSVTLALLLVSWATVGFDGMLSYATLLGQLETMGAEYAMFPASYHTLSGALLRAFGVSGWIWLLLAGLLAVLVYWQIKQGFSPSNYALLILAGVLMSPHTHLQDLSVMLPTVTLGWEALKQRRALSTLWASLWFAVGFGLYALVLNRYLLRDSPLLTVPVMLLAAALLMFHQRLPVPAARKPLARIAGAEQQ